MMSALTVVSNPIEHRLAMERLLADDAETWCSLKGLMSQLDLPNRPTLEIETGDGWTAISLLAIRADGVTFYSGTNGSTMTHAYYWVEGIPRWRLAPRSRPIFAFGHHL